MNGALWIWMGEHTAADSDRIPDISFVSDDGMRTLTGLIPVNANWCLDDLAPPVRDALLDNYGKHIDDWLNMRWDSPGITAPGNSRCQ